jgi:hypothetical protein
MLLNHCLFGHSYTVVWSKFANMKKSVYLTHVYRCSKCGKEMTRQKEVQAA